MDRIRDVRETSGDELLTSTSGGLLDAQYLSGDPPAAYLEAYEQPQYVLRNKKAGVTVAAGPTSDDLSPDDDHQTLAVVTDCRVVFLAGQAGGDRVESIPLDDVVEVGVESSGFLKSALTLEVVGGDRWRFPVRGDASEVGAFLDDGTQTWANARRLTEEASDHVKASRDHLESGEFAAARQVLSDVAEKVETARTRVSTVGEGAAQALNEKAGGLLDRLRQLEQEIAATKGAHHHATAQDAWKRDHDFERAAEEYEHATKEYERALAADGTDPPDEALQLRLKGVIKERAVLRAAPMADARAAREVAKATEDPDEAATEWETALTCYREAVTLDWGERDRTFITDRERAERRAVEATEEALDAHVEAGEEWVAAGDRIVRNGRREQGLLAYERAKEHFERAHEIARELAPKRVDDFEQRLGELRHRKTSEVVPPSETNESTLSPTN
jgi:tetratricopeptide (TPR) repeat protein